MPGFLESQIPINLFFQSLGAWLTPFMKAFTYLGQEDFFLPAIVLIYWLFDRRVGLRVCVLLLLSNGLNCLLKLAFHMPRPFWIDTRVTAMANEPSFGFPSGHTQNATTTWGGFLLPMKKPWAVAAYALIIVLVAVSRMYLGMHFLIDTLGGLVFGLLTVAAYLALEPRLDAWVSRQSLRRLILAAAACSLAFILVFQAVQVALGGWQVPAQWVNNARVGWPEDPIDPLSIRNLIKSAGTIFGFLGGAAWIARKYPGYTLQGTRSQKLQRLSLGLGGILLIYAGLGLVIPKDSSITSSALTYIRFALVGFWGGGLAPFLFMKTRLVMMAGSPATQPE